MNKGELFSSENQNHHEADNRGEDWEKEGAGYLVPSCSFLSKEVLREMVPWTYWNICCPGLGPWVGEARDKGGPPGTAETRCQAAVVILKGVGAPS